MKKEYQLPKEFAQKWIEALRSEDYTQMNGALYNGQGYCCLGVACKVVGIEDKFIEDYTTIPKDNELFKDIPERLRGNYSTNKLVGILTLMNDGLFTDSKRYTFNEIANWIEKNIEFV